MLRVPRALARATAIAAIATAVLPVLADAILVAPHALFITHDDPTGEVYLLNQGEVAEEVTVELRYGFPATDSLGNIMIRFVEEPGPEHPSAADWLRAFPRRARVEPGQRQRVRIQATPPADLPDGEYWSRLMVTSRPVEEASAVVDTTVRAGVTLQLRTITSVTYRKGPVATGLHLDGFRASAIGDSVEAWVSVTREGNAAFLGSVRLELIDPAGKVIASHETPLAVYFEQNRRFVLPIPEVEPGRYRMRLLLSTEREDIDTANILPAPPIERLVDLDIG
jgi:hypothetical protein